MGKDSKAKAKQQPPPPAPAPPPVPPAPAVPPGGLAADPVAERGRRLPDVLPVAGLVERLTGSKLCYGEPIRDAGRTVIPVARVRAAGGVGFGRGRNGPEEGGGGGGGGTLDAVPLGYVEIGPEGTRFVRIEDPETVTRTIKAVTTAAVTLATAFAGLRAARRGRRRLSRGR